MMDIRLHYIERGAGFPLILLHGNGENLGYFDRQMDDFAARFHVYAVDTRGHGQSPRGDAPFHLAQFAEDLLDFMNQRAIAKAHILGFSDGANIAMLFALKFPDRVARLILDGGNMRPSGVKLSFQLPILLGYGCCALISLIDPKVVAKKEMLGLMVNEPKLTARDLSQLTMPTLVVAGTRDIIRASHTQKIHRSIPGSRLALLEGGHCVAREHPETFNPTILDFLAEASHGD